LKWLWNAGKSTSLVVASLVGTSIALSEQTKLALTGSSTIAPLAAEVGKRFETHHRFDRPIGMRQDELSVGA
jgi:ABC-type phosphate transport system substrate-binding protein